jgi:hypothetical protein
MSNISGVMCVALYKDRDPWSWGALAVMFGPFALWILLQWGDELGWENNLNAPRSNFGRNHHNRRTQADKASQIAYKASIKAGNSVSVAKRDGSAAKKRFKAQDKIRRRYNAHELERAASKKQKSKEDGKTW